ncbi:F-box protein At-B isoform X2 [Andrographis paniculata]|uniref:F-box protein At-B isoform X2 n=1 Tax=Andrographis paniculata TaxID=175694 RepID=UPI0021E96C51|nr:F-box protein At-B isoform X2 [Andrographis paniculata]
MEENCDDKRRCVVDGAVPAEACGGAPPQDGFPLPASLILGEILPRLELESLCSLACVCRVLRSNVSHALSILPSLDLSAFSMNGELLNHIFPKMGGVESVSVDCLHLDDCSILSILRPNIHELNLLKCALLSYEVLPSIGEKCPNLRKLALELAGQSLPGTFRFNLLKMLEQFSGLEHLSIKNRGTERHPYDLGAIHLFLPKSVTFLKLQPVNEKDAILLIERLGDDVEVLEKMATSSIPSQLPFTGFRLRTLSLVLDVITNRLIATITTSLRLLVELDLEDRACSEPKLPHDLTNLGLQSLGSCEHLTSLSIVRSRVNYIVSFKRVNDLGIMLLAESCRGLESVKLGGFSKVTCAGFSSILCSCRNLKKFEVRNAPLLTDLAFHDIDGVSCPLVELKLLSCNLITSEFVAQLGSSNALQVLDTNGCRSIADSCLEHISPINTLTSLNLGGADITDRGLSILGKANLPLTSLSLRGITRVTSRGIISLFSSGDRIKKTLSSLDIGHMPGISDRAIHAIVSGAESLTELCMRGRVFVG